MELIDLVGKHFLSGVDFEPGKEGSHINDDDGSVINFILDGTTYTVTEDPEDGYRSCMREIEMSKAIIKNTFRPIEVFAWNEENILMMKCTTNDKLVLRVGTDNYDDYYPSFVAQFIPENIPKEEVADHRTVTGRLLRPLKK